MYIFLVDHVMCNLLSMMLGADAMYYFGAVNILCFLFKICAYLMKIYHLQYQELGNQKVTEDMYNVHP